jgi:hypothetical protein
LPKGRGLHEPSEPLGVTPRQRVESQCVAPSTTLGPLSPRNVSRWANRRDELTGRARLPSQLLDGSLKVAAESVAIGAVHRLAAISETAAMARSISVAVLKRPRLKRTAPVEMVPRSA